MIKLANTVANPWAMMIHPDDAPLADGAMMHSLLFNYITLEAVTHFIQ